MPCDPRKPGDTAEAPFMARYRELEAELAHRLGLPTVTEKAL